METQAEKVPAIELRGITKTFGQIVANRDINLTAYRGEILSILGENGSGKTTLMNMICGIYYPDAGRIFIDGKEALIRTPRDAFSYRIGMIHQHFKLVDVFSAAENIVLGLHEAGKYDLSWTYFSEHGPDSYEQEKKREKAKAWFNDYKQLFEQTKLLDCWANDNVALVEQFKEKFINSYNRVAQRMFVPLIESGNTNK